MPSQQSGIDLPLSLAMSGISLHTDALQLKPASFYVVTFQSSGFSAQSIAGHDRRGISLHLPKFLLLTTLIMLVLLRHSSMQQAAEHWTCVLTQG